MLRQIEFITDVKNKENMDKPIVLQLKGITKRFGTKVVANDHVDLDLRKGEILSILGENGSGKTTLMNMIIGIYRQDEGSVFINGEEVSILSPKDAYKYKIGMVHQHFKLVDVFTATDNIILGEKEPPFSIKNEANCIKEEAEQNNKNAEEYNPAEHTGVLSYLVAPKKQTKFQTAMKIAALPFVKFGKSVKFNWLSKNHGAKLQKIADKYGFDINLNEKIYNMSVSEKQTVEIIKVLYRGADILILDEPTAVLTPQEIEELMQIMRGLAKEGKSILFISHKLNEIMEVADRCTVLRRGKYIGTVDIKDTTKELLSRMMVGRDVELTVHKEDMKPGDVVLSVENLTVASRLHKKDAVKNVSFDVRGGEIVCIAGIDGNGQTELVYGITGLEHVKSGKVTLCGEDITHSSIRKRNTSGMSHIPEDRHKHGLVLDYSLEENMVLQRYFEPEFTSKFGFLKKDNIRKYSESLIEQFDIRSGQGSVTAARSMSGGNQQKAIVAREIDKNPELLVAVQPTRGLDVGAIEFIHKKLVEIRNQGKAVLLVSLELEEVMSVPDRILVMYEGEIVGELDPKTTTTEELGLYMAGAKRGGHKA